LNIAILDAQSRASDAIISGDLGGLTLAPGVYTVATDIAITNILYLDAQHNPNAAWIFQIGTSLTVNNGAKVIMTNVNTVFSSTTNVWWVCGSSATIGTTAEMIGVIMAEQSVSAASGSRTGPLLAYIGAVTLLTNSVTKYEAVTPPTAQPTSRPTSFPTISLSPTFLPTVQTLAIVVIDNDFTVLNYTGTALSDNDKLPLARTVAEAYNVDETAVEFLYYTYNGSVVNRRLQTQNRVDIVATTRTTLNYIDYPDYNSNSTALIAALQARMTSSINSGNFTNSMRVKSLAFNSSNWVIATVNQYPESSLNVQQPPSFSPTTTLFSAGGNQDKGLKTGGIALVVVFVCLGVVGLIAMCFCVFCKSRGKPPQKSVDNETQGGDNTGDARDPSSSIVISMENIYKTDGQEAVSTDAVRLEENETVL
jgi:hypothetical protein